MKNLKIYKVLSLALVFLGVSSCTTDFEEINTNNNAPTTENAAADQLLTAAIESVSDRVHEIFLGHEMGSCWAQQMAKCQYTDEDRYIYRTAVVNNTWASFYAANGEDLVLLEKTGVKVNNPNYVAVAMIMKAYVVSVLTDLFGDVPYTEAWKGDEGILSPKYDTQESIYADLLVKLEEANDMIDPSGTPIAGDILFGNDLTMWKKFSNSLRLRLLLRMSDRDEAFVTTEMSAIIADPDTYPIFEAGEDAALVYLGSAPNNNPINENRKTRDDHRVSKNFTDLLDYYNDYRIMVYAKPSANDEFEGIPNGLSSADAAAYNGNGLANTSKIGDYFTAATAPGMLMSYAELQFILAEAAHRNFIPGGETAAEAYYNEGIAGSFEQYREALETIIEDHAEDGTYGGWDLPASVDAAIAQAQTNAAYNPANATQLIAEQRYIATFDQGLQSWFEWRRTGYPVLTVPPANANNGKIPVRVPYPLDEAIRNGSNMDDAIAVQGPDNLDTRVWWDVNPN